MRPFLEGDAKKWVSGSFVSEIRQNPPYMQVNKKDSEIPTQVDSTNSDHPTLPLWQIYGEGKNGNEIQAPSQTGLQILMFSI